MCSIWRSLCLIMNHKQSHIFCLILWNHREKMTNWNFAMLCKLGRVLWCSIDDQGHTGPSWGCYSLWDANHRYGVTTTDSSAICWHVWGAENHGSLSKKTQLDTPVVWTPYHFCGFVFFQKDVTEILVIFMIINSWLDTAVPWQSKSETQCLLPEIFIFLTPRGLEFT